MTNIEALKSILAETVAQLEKYSSMTKESMSLTSMLQIAQEKPLHITTVAISEGLWRNVYYPAEVIKEASPQILNIPGKVEHGYTEKYKGRTIGRALSYEWDDMLRALKFTAEITDKEAIEDILSGKLRAISLQFLLSRICEECGREVGDEGCPQCGSDARILAKDLHLLEWSLVQDPAVPTARIFTVDAEVESVNREHLSNVYPFMIDKVYSMSKAEAEAEGELVELKEGEVLVYTPNGLVNMTLGEATAKKLPYYKLPPDKYPKYPKYIPPYNYPYGYYYYYPEYGYAPSYPGYYDYYPYYPEYSDELKEAFIKQWNITAEEFDKMYKIFGDKLFLLLDRYGVNKEAKEADKEEKAEESKSNVECEASAKDNNINDNPLLVKEEEAKEEEKLDNNNVEATPEEECPFCLAKVSNMDEHLPKCEAYLSIAEIKCKFCGMTFKLMKELIEHLKECEGYQKYKYPEKYPEPEEQSVSTQSLSQADTTNEAVKEEPAKVEEAPKEEATQTEAQAVPTAEEAPKEEAKTEEQKVEDKAEEKKEETAVNEEKTLPSSTTTEQSEEKSETEQTKPAEENEEVSLEDEIRDLTIGELLVLLHGDEE